MKNKDSMSLTSSLLCFGVALLAIGIALVALPQTLIGLPTEHVDFARELEKTLMWGDICMALGGIVLALIVLWYLCEVLEPVFRELFGSDWRQVVDDN